MNYDNRSLSLGSVELGYRIEGVPGAVAIVLMHGLNSHSGTWRKNIPYLARREGAFIVAPSLPPHRGAVGLSPEAVDAYAGQVLALLSNLGIDKATLVGNSMGGWVAMRMVSKNPGLASSVVLEDTAGTGSDDVRRLSETGVPVLIIWGSVDEIIPVSKAHDLNAGLAHSRLEVLDAVGHVPHWEAPDAFNELVGRFVGGGRP
jgi:pimeloyl-ACP methyl ester carboxylesterase